MEAQQLVSNLWSAIEAQQFDRALDYLACDFQFSRSRRPTASCERTIDYGSPRPNT